MNFVAQTTHLGDDIYRSVAIQGKPLAEAGVELRVPEHYSGVLLLFYLLVIALPILGLFVLLGLLWQAIDTEVFPDVPGWCRPKWLILCLSSLKHDIFGQHHER
jgi:hypothetical protein